MDFKFNLRRILKRQKSSKASPVPATNDSDAEPHLHRSQNNRPVTANSAAPTPTGHDDDHHLLRQTASLREQPSTNHLGEDLTKSRPTVSALPVIGSSEDSNNTSFETLAVTDRRTSKASTDAEYLRTRELDNQPALVLQTPTPTSENGGRGEAGIEKIDEINEDSVAGDDHLTPDEEALNPPGNTAPVAEQANPPANSLPTPQESTTSSDRRQSIISGDNAPALQDLLLGEPIVPPPLEPSGPSIEPSGVPLTSANIATMLQRKIWVRRPGASATMVTVREDDLVDDVRDKVLVKYTNSLGRSYDAPDVTLRIAPRVDAGQRPSERLLSPEEGICRMVDSFYPGGQTVDEAIIIDIPVKRTPRPSPRGHNHGHSHAGYYAMESQRPEESGTDYFPIMPPAQTGPATIQLTGPDDQRQPVQQHVLRLPEHGRSISVLQTGHVPPLPSPGAATRRHRPKYARQHTSSPTIINHAPATQPVAVNPPLATTSHLSHRPTRHRSDSNASDRPSAANVPAPPPLPTPPAPEAPPTAKGSSTPPTPGGRHLDGHRTSRPRKSRKATPQNGTPGLKTSSTISSLLDGSVPPINVLIVEDNIINLKLLEAFMKRLKVRWSTAMNGQIAVNKWRAGGFHLVLMDIQLPIMSGLEATKEIRRLERINGIGVFSSSAPGTPMPDDGAQLGQNGGDGTGAEGAELSRDKTKDRLDMAEGLFKSPVIIVALTASSLQSDRHEALAAGCNDFLTKPVNFVWLERKVKEWGCMQALIDFDGWRKWKDFQSSDKDAKSSVAGGGAKKTVAGGKSPLLDGNGSVSKADLAAKAMEKKAKRDKRASTEVGNRRTSEGDGQVDGL